MYIYTLHLNNNSCEVIYIHTMLCSISIYLSQSDQKLYDIFHFQRATIANFKLYKKINVNFISKNNNMYVKYKHISILSI